MQPESSSLNEKFTLLHLRYVNMSAYESSSSSSFGPPPPPLSPAGGKNCVRRASFDIGSSSTKMQCSDCEITRNGVTTVVNVLYSAECRVPFAEDWTRSQDGSISEEMQQHGLSVVRTLRAKAVEMGVQEYAAIATDVFRKASNGPSYLDRVRELNIPVTLVSQAWEAELAYTAIQSEGEQTPVWDSGGASFQITTMIPDNHLSSSSSPPPNPVYLTYLASLGTAITTDMLAREIQRKEYLDGTTVNPVSEDELSRLLGMITSRLPPVPDWLRDRSLVSAAAGYNSLFMVCCQVLQIHRREASVEAASKVSHNSYSSSHDKMTVSTSNEGDKDKPVTWFTVECVDTAIRKCLNCTDSELAKYSPASVGTATSGEDTLTPSSPVVQKLCLLLAVLRHTGIKKVKVVPAIGCCNGIMKDSRFW